MNRTTRWIGIALGLAVILGVLTVSAQIRHDARVPPRLGGEPRGTDERQPPRDTLRAGKSLTTPAERAPQMPSDQPDPRGPVRVAALSSRDVRDWNTWATRMARGRDLRLRRIQEDTILRGRWHERYDQFYKGVPVFGGDIVRQTTGNVALSIFGTVYAGMDLDVTPTLSPEDAVAIFEKEVGTTAGPNLEPRLMVLPKDDGSFVLVYRLTQFTGDALPVLFVNATAGRVERRYDNLQTQQAAIGLGTGVLGDHKKFSGTLQGGVYLASDWMRPPVLITFDLAGNLARTKDVLNGRIPALTTDISDDTDNVWTDGPTVDAHCHLGWTYDYFFKRFGRHGLDGNNAPIRAIVHPVSRYASLSNADISTYLLNAFWCGDCGIDGKGFLMFGEGIPPGYYVVATGQHFDYWSAALDIVSHELTHGLTSYTSNLTYQNESGALDEAFSDIMGTSVEFYSQPPGDGPLKADYLIGEDVVTALRPGSLTGVRSLADPGIFGDPDHYSMRYRGSGDYGGVHTNCTIGAHAFYLAIEGGTNRTSGLAVQGVGAAHRDQIEKVFYRAFVYYLTSNANFSTARVATIRSAQELYGAGSTVDRAITQAWTAVGVF